MKWKDKYGRVLRYMAKNGWKYLIGLVALVFVDLVQLRIPQITGTVTDGLEQGTMDVPILWQNVLALLLAGALIAFGRFLWRIFIFGTSRNVEKMLRHDFFAKLEELSLNFFNHHKTGDLMAYATNDLNAIRMMVGPGLLMALDAIILTAFVVFKMMTSINVQLTLLSIIPLPFIAIGSLFFGRVIRKRFKDKQEAFARMSDMVQENISGMRVIKAFVKEAFECEKFAIANRDNYDKNMRVVRLFAVMMPLVSLISGLSLAISLWFGGRMTMNGVISLGEYVAFVQYLMMLVWPMMAFGWCVNIYSQGLASLNRFEEIMHEEIEIFDGPDARLNTVIRGGFEIKNLTFDYEGTPALLDVDLKVAAGSTLGIVGRTGSGKTTLVNLLLRLYNPPEASIFLDGQDIMTMPLKDLRQTFGYVPQDNFLFSDTIHNNIGFGEEEVDKEDVISAAKWADVHHNIEDFTLGYETVVGERGVTLSGGQKQRVSIARAMLLNRPILILDDAVSAVDTKTEEAILSTLKDRESRPTTIIIAHRISTLQHADQIIVMDQGRIVERGNHDSLMADGGLYSSMVHKQQLEAEINEGGKA